MSFADQRDTFRQAKAEGWTGDEPSVIGGFYAMKALDEAETFLQNLQQLRQQLVGKLVRVLDTTHTFRVQRIRCIPIFGLLAFADDTGFLVQDLHVIEDPHAYLRCQCGRALTIVSKVPTNVTGVYRAFAACSERATQLGHDSREVQLTGGVYA